MFLFWGDFLAVEFFPFHLHGDGERLRGGGGGGGRREERRGHGTAGAKRRGREREEEKEREEKKQLTGRGGFISGFSRMGLFPQPADGGMKPGGKDGERAQASGGEKRRM